MSIAPLAERMRPKHIDGYVGQSHILGTNKPLRVAIEKGSIHSLVFWGPPGSGKTTLAKLIATQCNMQFLTTSAVFSGVKDIRIAIDKAKQYYQENQQGTILFIDEVHRFNKAQQDAFLPHVEQGTIILIGATTENPSFELNNALLSRVRVYVLKSLNIDDLNIILKKALDYPDYEYAKSSLTADDLNAITEAADGDARRALNFLECINDILDQESDPQSLVQSVLSNGGLRRFDKGGDAFYDQISALHKSIRGSNPDAALYWFACMVDGGCDPLYIARRLVRIASEDIGNADPRCLQLALNAWQSYERLGSPEGELSIAQAVIYLACAPKSYAVYKAYQNVFKDLQNSSTPSVPLHLRNAPTKLMKSLNYGKGYRYAHDDQDAFAAGVHYFPDDMPNKHYYHPVDRGLEIKIAEKLKQLRDLDDKAKP